MSSVPMALYLEVAEDTFVCVAEIEAVYSWRDEVHVRTRSDHGYIARYYETAQALMRDIATMTNGRVVER